MALPDIVTRDEWLAARKRLLEEEKQLTRRIDALNADRRRLPMTRVDKDYRFQGVEGEVGLADLFQGRRQLIVQHVMFAPDWDDACSGCTASLDELAPGVLRHLAARETSFVLVSRAPLAKLVEYRDRKGWFAPWYSSYGTDFNYDFDVTMDESVKPPVYNYRPLDKGASGEQPGVSSFLKVGDDVFHTYSTYGRGTDHAGGAYGFLDLTALGRQEEWEEPKGRNDAPHPNMPTFT